MTTFKINKYDIEYFVDENEFKQNKFTPIDKIPIYGTQKLHKDPPDVIVIFAWNFAESIFKKYSYLKNKEYNLWCLYLIQNFMNIKFKRKNYLL